jgi:ADP-heptose:LPS heptosyltransferase
MIVRLRSLGDCILSTPAIHLLKLAHPHLQIAVVVEPEWRPVFERNPDVCRILQPLHREVWQFRPDVCIDFHGGNTAARLMLLSGAKYRAGYAHFKRRAVYNVRIPRAQDILETNRTVHTVEHMASAMFYLGVPPDEIPRARLFGDRAQTLNSAYAVIHPVAATAAKTWPVSGFLEVADHLHSRHGLEPVFISGSGQDLSAFSHWKTISGAPLGDVKTLISGASLFVGNDSGPAHIAAAFGVPPVVIFGPSDPLIWGPWSTRGEVIKAQGPIDSIRAEQVTAAIDRVTVPV